MTTFEFFKAQYDQKRDYARTCIKAEIETDSFHFVEICGKNVFGGTAEVDPMFNIIGVDDTQEQIANGVLWKKDGYRNGKPVRFVGLTKKGMKAFYKAMF